MSSSYVNRVDGEGRLAFRLRRCGNRLRTWWKLGVCRPWVRYAGFVRVMKAVSFAKGKDIRLGSEVQFGPYCDVATSLQTGDWVLVGSHVLFLGRHDHDFSVPGRPIWEGERGGDGPIVLEDDVWIGSGSVVLSGVRIGCGSILAAGSVLTHDIPPCEIWGGQPARKLRDRFATAEEREAHLAALAARKPSNR